MSAIDASRKLRAFAECLGNQAFPALGIISLVRSDLFKLVVFASLCFLMLEQSYRVYSVGWVAFSVVKMNSMTSILNSGLVELSEEPEVYYQLKPHLDTYFKSVELRTNSYGLADKEYTLKKTPGTIRIAVVGSSWSMASGVPTEASYHAVLEDRFNSDPDTPAVEFINFSVEFYSLREIVGVVKTKVAAWDPDVILIPVTFTTAAILFESIVANRELPTTIYPFYSSFVLRELNRFGIPWPLPVDPLRPSIRAGGMGIFRNQLIRSLLEVNVVAKDLGARTMMVWLGFEPLQQRVRAELEKLADDTGIIVVRGNTPLLGTKAEQEKLRISRFDRHPNEEAHLLVADVIESAILENDLLSLQADL